MLRRIQTPRSGSEGKTQHDTPIHQERLVRTWGPQLFSSFEVGPYCVYLSVSNRATSGTWLYFLWASLISSNIKKNTKVCKKFTQTSHAYATCRSRNPKLIFCRLAADLILALSGPWSVCVTVPFLDLYYFGFITRFKLFSMEKLPNGCFLISHTVVISTEVTPTPVSDTEALGDALALRP